MSYLKDPWLQIFGFLALASGALAALGRPQAPVPAAAAAAVSALAAPAAPAPAPPAPRAKVPGKWVVDAALADDADTAKLGDALAAAAAGDVIYVRAGTYKGPFVARRDVTLAGLGARAAIVLDSDQPGPSFAVEGASATLKNLTISHAGAAAGSALSCRRAVVRLSAVALRAGAQDDALDVLGGEAALEDGVITGGRKGVDAHDDAKAALTRTTVTKAETGVFVQGASVTLTDSYLIDDERGLTASEQGRAFVTGGEVSRDAGGLWATRGGRIRAASVHFNLDVAGVLADENGRVELFSTGFFGLTGAALQADSSGEIDDSGSSIVRGKAASVVARGRATLKLDGTRIEDGSGDAADVVDGASASLSGVKFARNAGAGLSVRNAQTVSVANSSMSDHTRCAIEVSGAALTLKSARLTGNLCGVAFFGQAVLDADASVFTGNRRGPFQYSADQKNEIVVRGSGNEPGDLAALIH